MHKRADHHALWLQEPVSGDYTRHGWRSGEVPRDDARIAGPTSEAQSMRSVVRMASRAFGRMIWADSLNLVTRSVAVLAHRRRERTGETP
jgi:hypothetical protein